MQFHRIIAVRSKNSNDNLNFYMKTFEMLTQYNNLWETTCKISYNNSRFCRVPNEKQTVTLVNF